jgi:enamine deaminase RidA (YjgF/YER057c/UK114 family)
VGFSALLNLFIYCFEKILRPKLSQELFQEPLYFLPVFYFCPSCFCYHLLTFKSLFILKMLKSNRINISSGAKWENIVGYSRAVKVGNIIEVSGTTAVDEHNEIQGLDDAYQQTKFIILKAEKALIELGSSLADVIRTRIYTTDISKWEEIGRAHGEFFRAIKPAATMVEVRKLIDKNILVEIEFTAISES